MCQCHYCSVQVRCLLRQSVSALCHLHSLGLTHGSLRASSLLLSLQGDLKIGDWGLHNLLSPAFSRQWDPPAQLLPEHRDVWALGVLVAELLLPSGLPYRSYRVTPQTLLQLLLGVTGQGSQALLLAKTCLLMSPPPSCRHLLDTQPFLGEQGLQPYSLYREA